MKKIHRAIFPFRGSRMRIEVIKNETGNAIFKENSIKAKVYPVSPKLARQIEIEHEKIKRSMDILRDKGMPEMWLGYVIRCWQKIEVLKVPLVVDLIIKQLQKGRSVAIFINYSETKRLIFDRLIKMDVGVFQHGDDGLPLSLDESQEEKSETLITAKQIGFIDGGQSPVERDLTIEAFREDKIHLIIAQIKAGGVGISLHDIRGERPRVSYIFPSWSAIDMKQALGRIYRADAKTNAKQRIVYCSTGVEPPGEQFEQEEKEELFKADSREAVLDELTKLASEAETKEEINEKTAADLAMEDVHLQSQLSVEEILCKNVNKKLKNIELLNEGHTNNHLDIIKDEEK